MSLPTFLAECDAALEWLCNQQGRPWHTAGTLDSLPSVYQQARDCLRCLVETAIRLAPVGKPPPIEMAHVKALHDENVSMAMLRVKQLKHWAASLLATDTEHTPPVGPCDQPAEQAAHMTWQKVAERLERLRTQGEPFTSQHNLAKQLCCSSGTINKAIRETPSLHAWAKKTDAAPRAQSLNDVVTDRTAQSRELDPSEETAIREYLEREDLTPEARAFFNSLSTEDQLDFLDDPDKHQRVLGRKP
jgi:hypothetical protein